MFQICGLGGKEEYKTKTKNRKLDSRVRSCLYSFNNGEGRDALPRSFFFSFLAGKVGKLLFKCVGVQRREEWGRSRHSSRLF